MKNIPIKLNILGRMFSIICEDMVKNACDDMGAAQLSSQTIWVDNTVHIQQQEETLIHETIEMINKLNELHLDHPTICVLSTSLYQILSENKLQFGDTKNE